MNGRQFVAAAAVPLSVGTAGCSLVSGRTVELADPEIETQQDGREKYRIYHHDGDEIIAVGFQQGSTPESLNDRFTFRITMPYSEAAKVESFQFDLRASQSLTDPLADIYLRFPGEAWSGLTCGAVLSEGNRWTRIALPETGEIGDETIYQHRHRTHARTGRADRYSHRARTRFESGLEGTTYRVNDSATFEPTTEPIGETATE